MPPTPIEHVQIEYRLIGAAKKWDIEGGVGRMEVVYREIVGFAFFLYRYRPAGAFGSLRLGTGWAFLGTLLIAITWYRATRKYRVAFMYIATLQVC